MKHREHRHAKDRAVGTTRQAAREASTLTADDTSTSTAAGVGSVSSGLAGDASNSGTQSVGLTVNDDELRDEINKRLTMNWLIQGAAQHAGMTFHHLVRNELDAIDPKLVRLYDQYALINLLQYWHLEAVLLCGWPPRFWRRAATNRKHPFFDHPVLSRHGGMLAETSRRRGLERCREKGLSHFPILFQIQATYVIAQLSLREARHSWELVELAKKTVAMVWGISPHQLEAELTRNVAFGNLSPPRTAAGRAMRACAVGYGGVLRRGNSLVVVGKGTNWYLLTKELVKGTAELIGLHGLNGLSDDVYQGVIRAADGVDFEPWMLHTGGELWRRLLAVLPTDRSLAQMLMHLARLPAKSLETLVLAIIEQPEWARELLAGLGGVP